MYMHYNDFSIMFHCVKAGSVYVTWNGTKITEPLMIFEDEIVLINNTEIPDISNFTRPGALICISQSASAVAWYFANGTQIPDAPATTIFQQTREIANISRSLLSRGAGSVNFSDGFGGGLFICRLNITTDGEVLVGISHREDKSSLISL